MANMSVSGTYRPPYGPNRPRASGRACVAAIGMGALNRVPGGARLLCRFRPGNSSNRAYGPAERGDGEDDRVEFLEVPELGEVEADGRGVGEGAVLHPAHEVFDPPIDGRPGLRRGEVEEDFDGEGRL